MKTILPAKENIAHLWGYPKMKDTVYRLMKYLIRVEVDDGVLLHNNVTKHLVLLSKEEADILSRLPAKVTEPMQELISNHFLVPEEYDEYKAVNQLRKIYRNRSTGDSINHYIILPTTFCNAHCFYCYESDYPHIHMTEETANKLISFIDEHRKGKGVFLDWFGGEPMVGIQRIDQISQGMKDRGIPYSASMVSNGYLFDESIIEKSIKLWNLEKIQITLDGTEEVYNRVKAYTNAKENPYHRVLRNIDMMSKNGIRVSIRLNVDFYNREDIRKLIEELGERYSGVKNITVYMNMLFNHQGFEPVHHTEDDRVELVETIRKYTNRLMELKLGIDRKSIPCLTFSQCMADNPHAIEIQPDGSFCRCEHETVTDSYGNLDDGILDPQKPLLWQEAMERSDYCPECCVYPSCYLLRRCMNADIPCNENIRRSSYTAHMEQLSSIYYKSMEGKGNERVQESGN